MAVTVVGRVQPLPRGQYNPTTTYALLDIVSYEGESYIALKSTTGNPPTTGENWQLIAAAGENVILRNYDNHIQWKHETDAEWLNLIDLDEIKGEQGDKGDRGFAATISVGSVTSVESGQPAKVTNVGTSQDALFNFEIPKGASGSGSGDMLTSVYDPDQTGVVLAAEHADDADKLSEAIDIELTGAVTGKVESVDGSANISIATQIPIESITPNKLDREYAESSLIQAWAYEIASVSPGKSGNITVYYPKSTSAEAPIISLTSQVASSNDGSVHLEINRRWNNRVQFRTISTYAATVRALVYIIVVDIDGII